MRIASKRNKNPLRYGFYFILVLFAGFIVAGFLNRSLKIETYSKVERSSAEVIPFLTEPDLISKWVGKSKSISIVKGEAGKEGSMYTISYRDGQKSSLTIVSLDEQNNIFSYLIESDITIITVSIELEQLSDGTTDITQHSSIQGNDLLTRSILLFLKNMYTRDATSNLERLKYEVENS